MERSSNSSAISRWKFLARVGGGAGVVALGPTILSATNKSGSKVVLGSGSHKYELVREWGRLLSGVQYGYTHGVQIDSHNRVIVHNQSKDSVIIFDHKGKYIKSWGPEFQKGAHGCLLRKEGGAEFLYLSDYERHVVVKTTLGGETVWTLNWPQDSGVYKSETEFKPIKVAVAPSGDIYVTDGYGLSYVRHPRRRMGQTHHPAHLRGGGS